MPQLSASNRSQLAYKLEGIYPANFGVLQAGSGTNLNMLSETLDFSVKNVQSNQIRSDGQIADITQVGATTQGGIALEAQYREYDPFIENVMKAPFTAYGTLGVSAAMTGTLTATSTTVLTNSVATAGSDLWTLLDKGQWFTLIPVTGASQAVKDYLAKKPFRVSLLVAPTATVITLDASTPIDATIITAPLAVGWKFTSSRLYNGTTTQVLKSYSMEVGHSDVSVFRQYLGMMASKYSLKLSVGAIVTGAIDFMGKLMTTPMAVVTGMGAATASQTFTPANATKGVIDVYENEVALSATTYVKSAEMSIDISLRMQDAIGVFGTSGLAAGTYKVMGKLEMYLADTVVYNKLLSGVATAITLPLLDVNGNGYIYYFPKVKYTIAKVAVGGLDQDNMLSLDWTAVVQTDVTSPAFGKTCVIYRVGV